MSNEVRGFIALTGGTAGALDAIADADLTDQDYAFGVVAGVQHCYWYDDDSGVAENSPYVIAPDDVGEGDGRWILSGFQPAFSHVIVEATGGQTITSGSPITIQYNSEIKDLLGEFNTGTYTFTAIYAGYYLVTATILSDVENWGAGSSLILTAVPSVATPIAGVRPLQPTVDSKQASGFVSGGIYLTASETLHITVYSTNSGSIDLATSSNRLDIHRIA